jgi:ClpP class serine protease
VSQEIQNEVQSQIKSYRGDRLKEANFELMSSDQALKAGLIDGVGTFQETIDKEYPGAKVYYVPDGSQSIKERLKRLRSRFGMLVQSTQ